MGKSELAFVNGNSSIAFENARTGLTILRQMDCLVSATKANIYKSQMVGFQIDDSFAVRGQKPS